MSSVSILHYTAALLPIFKKDRILDDARVVQTELLTNTIPVYESSESLFAPKLVKSKELNNFSKTYFTYLGGNNPKGMIADISARLKHINAVVNYVTQAAENKFETSVVVDGITLYKVSLIKVLELCGFISRYSLRFLNYAYILEAGATGGGAEDYLNQELSKAEVRELDKYFADYCRTLKSLSRDPKQFMKDVEQLPDIVVGPNSEATMSNLGTTKLDPLNLFAVNGFVNPIYRIRMGFAERQVSRYKEAKELKTNLELRKIYLENYRASGSQDEATQKEINVIQSRIDRCAEQIRKTEESVGL